MEREQRTTRSQSRKARELEERDTTSRKKPAQKDEQRITRVKKPAAAEVKQPSTVPRKPATTTFQKTEAVPPSTSRHRQQTSAEGNYKTRDEGNRSAYGSLANFDITPLAAVLKFRRILSKASIPSPLWPGALKWQPTGENRLFMNARDLYREIFSQRRTLQQEVKTQAGFYNPVRRSKGLLCWWEYLKKKSKKNRDDDSDDESDEGVDPILGDLNYAWVGETMDFNSIGLKAELKVRNEMSVTGKDLNISRLRCKIGDSEAQPGEFRHFIVNYDQASLSINGIPIGMGRIAGPLPDFAVLEIDGSLLFWWGTDAALNFVPEQRSTTMDPKPSFADHQEYENLGEDLPHVNRSKPSSVSNDSLSEDLAPVNPSNSSTVNNENLGKELAPVNRSKPGTVDPKLGASTPAVQPPARNSATAGPRAGYDTSNSMGTFNTRPTGSGVASGGLSGWEAEFMQRLDVCYQSPSKRTDLKSTSNHRHRVRSYSNLKMDDVVLAIAALRFGTGSGPMGHCIGPLEHCIGNSDLYAYTRQQPECGMACAGTSNSFIIPLFFDDLSKYLKGENESSIKPPPLPKQTFAEIQAHHEPSAKLNLQSKPELSHCMLAFARCDDNEEVVSIDFYDSNPQGQPKNLIRETARNLVRNSGWLPHDRPTFGEERWMLSPHQAGETSGVHTILNAWSVMINLPVNMGQSYQIDPTFYATARRVINLGLAGKLDSLTIRAFLQAYQYARPQQLEEAIRNDSLNENPKLGFLVRETIRMNKTILNAEIGRMHEHDFEPESENDPPEPDTWSIRLKKTLERQMDQAMQSLSYKTFVEDGEALLDSSVHMAIASVWEALRWAGHEYAFGTIQTFRANRTQDTRIPGTEVVLGDRNLIIPLFFGREMPPQPVRAKKRAKKPSRTPIGHYVLAVLEKNSQDPQAEVKAHIFDSLPGNLPSKTISDAVDGLVRYTGWMGMDADGRPQPVTPNIQYIVHTSPHQESALSCGLNVIFNAWSVMLGIRIHRGEKRRTNTTSRKFLMDGSRIVNLALNGRMDLATIQMFLRAHGYSAVEIEPVTEVPAINTVALDERQLDNIMESLKRPRRAGATTLDTLDEADEIDDALLEFAKQGIDEDNVREALRQSRGDIQQATRDLELPKLSPKTTPPDTAAAELEPSLKELVVRGVEEDMARQLLIASNGDVKKAIELHIDLFPPEKPSDTVAAETDAAEDAAVLELVTQGNDENKARLALREALTLIGGDLQRAIEFLELPPDQQASLKNLVAGGWERGKAWDALRQSDGSYNDAVLLLIEESSLAPKTTSDTAAAEEPDPAALEPVAQGNDKNKAREALRMSKGDVKRASEVLQVPSPDPNLSPHLAGLLEQLVKDGYDKERSRRHLVSTNGDVDETTRLLMRDSAPRGIEPPGDTKPAQEFQPAGTPDSLFDDTEFPDDMEI